VGRLVDDAGEALLGVAEDEGPGEDLGGGVVDVGVGRARLLAGVHDGRLPGGADDHRLAGLLGLEAERDHGRLDEPEDGDADRDQGHHHRGDDQDVAEAADPELLAAARGVGSRWRRTW
jgi:hypothetical protein